MNLSFWRLLSSSGGSVDATILAQYGAVGFLAAAALVAAKMLFGRLEKQYHERDEERERELTRANDRADRLEAELSSLNTAVRDSMQALTAANRAVAEAMTRMRREP